MGTKKTLNNHQAMHFTYSDIETVSGFKLYRLERLSLNIEPKLTSEFTEDVEYPLVQYLIARRKPFFASSIYLIHADKKLRELNIDDLEKVVFSGQEHKIYYMDLNDFKELIVTKFDEMTTALNNSLVIVVDGEVTTPTENTIMILKDYNIQTGV